MQRLMIAFDTTEGQTKKIAERMAEVARGTGLEATVLNVREAVAEPIASFDAVIVGGSIHAAKHSRALEQFVRLHVSELSEVPAAFFSVSLSAAGTETQRGDARAVLEEFLTRTGWTPQKSEIFAGALLYREYGILKRWVMKMIVKRAGGDTDTSRNYEYTDWTAVEEFVRAFLQAVEQA